jgi:4-carboxymuconolactone decarboxylase
MAPSQRAQANHDELFPGRISTLAQTDLELIDYFDNFAFDEVLAHSELDTRTRLIVQLAAMIASQALSESRVMLGAAPTVGVTPVEVKEIVYQAVPYVGMAKVFDFIQHWLSANCFGDHHTRTGLDLATRELVTFAFLVSLGGCDPQVEGHGTGNLNVGNDRARLLDVLSQLLPFIGYPRTLNGLRALDEVAR